MTKAYGRHVTKKNLTENRFHIMINYSLNKLLIFYIINLPSKWIDTYIHRDLFVVCPRSHLCLDLKLLIYNMNKLNISSSFQTSACVRIRWREKKKESDEGFVKTEIVGSYLEFLI